MKLGFRIIVVALLNSVNWDRRPNYGANISETMGVWTACTVIL